MKIKNPPNFERVVAILDNNDLAIVFYDECDGYMSAETGDRVDNVSCWAHASSLKMSDWHCVPEE